MLLANQSTNRGVIVRVSGMVADVATLSGIVQAPMRTKLQVGTTVILRNGYAESVAVPIDSYEL